MPDQPTTGEPAWRAKLRGSWLGNLVVIGVTALAIGIGWWVMRPDPAENQVSDVEVAGVQPAPQVGEVAPGFTATATNGEEVSLVALSGRPVWLVFMATWCSACRAEMPDVQAASEALQKDMEARTGAAMRWMALTETNAVRTLAVILSSDPSVEEEFKDPMAATSAQISEVQKSLESMALREADKAQMGRIAEARSAMLALRGEARKIKAEGRVDEATALVKQKYVPASNAYLQHLRDFV